MPGVKKPEAMGIIYKMIGYQVYNHRKQCGLSQRQLAELVDIGEAAIRKLENGTQCIRICTLYKIARILDMDATDLFPNVDIVTDVQDEPWLKKLHQFEAE